jgi:signal transduction histidine kinase
MNLKLSQKAYILILVPLIFQCMFIGGLWMLHIHTESELEKQIETHSAWERVKSLVYSVWRAGALIDMYAHNGGADLRNHCVSAISGIEEQAQRFKQANENNSDPQTKRSYTKLSESIAKCTDLLHDALQSADGGSRDWKFVSPIFTLRSRDFLADLAVAMDEVTTKPVNDDSWKQLRAQQEQTLKLALLAGLGADLIIVALIAASFNRGTHRRLSVLVENIRRLAAKQSLLNPLDGQDEIANIDNAFHSMAKALADAAERELEIERLKRRFVALVSHDLRTPLASLRIFLSGLAENQPALEEAQVRDRAQMQAQNVDRLMSLLNDLLELEKMQDGAFSVHPKMIEVQTLCEQALETISDQASVSGIKLEYDWCSTSILADHDRIIQVLVNLLSNAIKFSQRGMTVRLSAAQKDSSIYFEIVDTGCGIADTEKDDVFEAFFQGSTKGSSAGTGLGLAICKSIVERHGGSMGVISSAGKGSTFWFTLPVTADANCISSAPVSL